MQWHYKLMLTHSHFSLFLLNLLFCVRNQNTIVPALYEYLLIWPNHLSITMLLVLRPSSNIFWPIWGSERALSILHIVLPLPLVFISLSCEKLAFFSMALACLPVANIEVLVVIVTLSMPIAQAFLPSTMVFVVCPFLFVCAVKDTLTITLVI